MDICDVASRLEQAGFNNFVIDHEDGCAVVWFGSQRQDDRRLLTRFLKQIQEVKEIELEIHQLYDRLSLARDSLEGITQRLLGAIGEAMVESADNDRPSET